MHKQEACKYKEEPCKHKQGACKHIDWRLCRKVWYCPKN
jgi:hypothetical protein